jgi:hypothetical protein
MDNPVPNNWPKMHVGDQVDTVLTVGDVCPCCNFEGLMRGPEGGGSWMVCCPKCLTEWLVLMTSSRVAYVCDMERVGYYYPRIIKDYLPRL